MGIVNVTPDSFSDGGCHAEAGAAIAHGQHLHRSGADIVDVGGESTRPGAVRVSATEEARRVLPVISALSAAGVAVSVDTMRAEIAREAVAAGAILVNDVSGGVADPAMLSTVADLRVPLVMGHWWPDRRRGAGHAADSAAQSASAMGAAVVATDLQVGLTAAAAAGIDLTSVVLDPGIGFAKSADDNWTILAHLPDLIALGRPLLIGVSRKSFLGLLLGSPGAPRPVREREDATTALSALVAAEGAWGVRVHNVGPSVDAVTIVARLRAAGSP